MHGITTRIIWAIGLLGLASSLLPAAMRRTQWTPDLVAPGTELVRFKSKLIAETSPLYGKSYDTYNYLIHLPPGYAKNTSKSYPVVYWLPGKKGIPEQVKHFLQHLDAAVAAGKAPEMIVVGVNGLSKSMYMNSRDGHVPVERVIIEELIPHVDATYRTIADRAHRAIEGFSMGGWGAPHLGFKFPELFGAVTVMAGALHHKDKFVNAKPGGTHWKILQEHCGGDVAYLEANNPRTLVKKNAASIRGKTFVRIKVGSKDHLRKKNESYSDLLTQLNIDHTFKVVPDIGHSKGGVYDLEGQDHFKFYLTAFAGAPLASLPRRKHP